MTEKIEEQDFQSVHGETVRPTVGSYNNQDGIGGPC